MSKASSLLAALLLALVIAAAATLAFAGRRPAAADRCAQEFHRLVGGLGFGPALDLSQCEHSFDPRLCPACPNDCGPIPGGLFFCPHHAGSVLDYPPLASRQGPGEADGPLP